jgi:hypothetical protein
MRIMNWKKELVIPKTIDDICEERKRVQKLVEAAHTCLDDASKILYRNSVHFPFEGRPRNSVEGTMREIDQRLWREAFDKTGLMQFMDRKARTEFENSLEKNPPEFTMDAVRATLVQTATNAEGYFKRGLVEFFLNLSKGHVTNNREPFKIDKRAIITYAAECWFGKIQINRGTYSRGMSTINDMDRVFMTLDDKQHNPRSLEGAINTAWAEGEPFENEYYQIKGFKNGNVHILFKRDDLLEKANRIIHDYYNGEALAEGRAA